MGLVLPKSYCKSTLSLHLQILEAGDIDGDGEEALELDDELAGAGAAPGLQGSDLAVEGAADAAHLAFFGTQTPMTSTFNLMSAIGPTYR